MSLWTTQLCDRTLRHHLCTGSAVQCVRGRHDRPLAFTRYLLKLVLPMETLTTYVKKKGSCGEQYCLGFRSKRPLLADCKNVKHINSFGSRIKCANGSNERWKQHFSLLVTVLCNWGPLNTVYTVPPLLLCEAAVTSGFPLCSSLFTTAILIEKAVIK